MLSRKDFLHSRISVKLNLPNFPLPPLLSATMLSDIVSFLDRYIGSLYLQLSISPIRHTVPEPLTLETLPRFAIP